MKLGAGLERIERHTDLARCSPLCMAKPLAPVDQMP